MSFLHRTWAEIDLSALLHNLNIIKGETESSGIMAVVKADAYGHSLEYTSPVLDKAGVDWFAVSNIDEALQLRKLDIIKPILILGYTPTTEVEKLSENNISQCVYSMDYAKQLSSAATTAKVNINIHIKLDTGMSRLGFNCKTEQLKGLESVIAVSRIPGLRFEGIFTHFAESDRYIESDDGFTNQQFDLFMKAVNRIKDLGIMPEIIHCCNSAATLYDKEKQLDVCRTGIILYGLKPSSAPQFDVGFKPVMTLKTVVSMVKEIDEDEYISYSRTFKTTEKMKIATISVGYADGYPRALSNKGYVIINGMKAPILGRVCMDQTIVDVSQIENVKIGDEVILFGKELSVDIIAELCNTINYEIVCGITQRVPRIVVN